MKYLQNDFFHESQSWMLTQVTLHEGVHPLHANATHVLLKVRIRRNAYDDQSWGQVRYWNADTWTCVIERPIQALGCAEVSYMTKEPDYALFESDADDLRKAALQVVASRASLKKNNLLK